MRKKNPVRNANTQNKVSGSNHESVISTELENTIGLKTEIYHFYCNLIGQLAQINYEKYSFNIRSSINTYVSV